MFDYAKFLKRVRLDRHLSQAQMAKDIVSRPTYSKYENGTVPDIETLSLLLERAGYNLADFAKEVQRGDYYDDYYRLFVKLLKVGGTTEQAQKLYTFVQLTKGKDNRSITLYGITKAFLASRYPSIIRPLDDNDKIELKEKILALLNVDTLGYYDYKLIGDFATVCLTKTELKTLYSKFFPIDPLDFAENKLEYVTQINKILNNFCDRFIIYNDLQWAEDILHYQYCFLSIHHDLRFVTYAKINEYSLAFRKTRDPDNLEKIAFYAELLENYYDDQATAKAIFQQVASMRIEPNAITHFIVSDH